jgi:hypothetical protein
MTNRDSASKYLSSIDRIKSAKCRNKRGMYGGVVGSCGGTTGTGNILPSRLSTNGWNTSKRRLGANVFI